MAKTLFVCTACGHQAPRWSGQCTSCGEWNTLVEMDTPVPAAKKGMGARTSASSTAVSARALPVSAVLARPLKRITFGMPEFERTLGGGMVPGSFTLLGGEPGIGKSTLTLQLAAAFAEKGNKVVLASGEESAEQIALRAARLGVTSDTLLIVASSDIDEIIATATAEQPALLIVDSAQVMGTGDAAGAPGSIGQIRAIAEKLMHHAKGTHIPTVLIGHVTKEGDLAGPKVLSHLVDTVLLLSGDAHYDLRLLKTTKNRFGATSEVGVFRMETGGLTGVPNPSSLFLEERQEGAPGSAVTVIVEGSRPLLVEVQALTASSSFGYPKRAASGFSLSRLSLLIAVLERHGGISLSDKDAYVNIAGGLTLDEPAADLAVLLALASSAKKQSLPAKTAFYGEVGLTGEIRSVSSSDSRAKEAARIGLTPFAPGKRVGELICRLFPKGE